MTRLNERTAGTTRGATCIGRAAAKHFIEEGSFVFCRCQKVLVAAVAELVPNARALKGSLSDEVHVDRLYAAAKSERGALDIFIANAGVRSQIRLGDNTVKHIDKTFDINVRGRSSRFRALPLMGKGGSTILTGSSAGTTGASAFTAYADIRVNVFSPGANATELANEALGEDGLEPYGSMTLRRMGDSAEVGAAAAFLASLESSLMTASEVAVGSGLAQL